MSGTFLGHAWVRVFYLEFTGTGITVDDLQSVADEVASLWLANTATYITNDVTLTAVDVRYIPSTGTELRYTGTYSDTGALAGPSVDDASAAHVIDYVISDYYRGGHPRAYMAGVATAYVTNGSDISAGGQANLVNAENGFRNALNAYTTTNITAMTMGTVRFESGGAWLSPPYFVAFTSVKYGKGGKLGSQRRRILS